MTSSSKLNYLNGHEEDRAELLRLRAGLSTTSLPGIEVMGAGYDVFSGYASSLSIVSPHLFDWEKAPGDTWTYQSSEYKKPAAISAVAVSTSDLDVIAEDDIETYQHSIAASISVEGSYNFFSGSVSTEFESSDLSKGEYAFSRATRYVRTWSLQLHANAKARSLLRKDFRDELDGLNAKDQKSLRKFFTDYGTHVLTGAVIGGSARRTSSTKKTTQEQSFDFAVSSRQSFQFAAGELKADESLKIKNSVEKFNETSHIKAFTVGGHPDKGGAAFEGGDNFKEWQESVVTAPVLVDFLPENPLTPIWELCDPDKGKDVATALAAYFEKVWAPERSKELEMRPDYIDAVQIVHGSESGGANVPPPSGFERDDQDLNQWSHGDYIYLCYHRQHFSKYGGNKDAIIDVDILYGKNAEPEKGWKKCELDLNKNAHGEYVYLAYQEGAYDRDTAILDLKVVSGAESDTDLPTPYGYTQVKKDLNKGAHGKTIYLCYLKRRKN